LQTTKKDSAPTDYIGSTLPQIAQCIAQRQAEIIKEIRLMGELMAKNARK
jgi:hypothetical protein